MEDDCLPMPGFYSFMRQALTCYESEKRVFSIGGYQPIPQEYFKGYPYSLVSTARFTCWGWATWQDRWELIRPYLAGYGELFDDLKYVPDSRLHIPISNFVASASGQNNILTIERNIAFLGEPCPKCLEGLSARRYNKKTENEKKIMIKRIENYRKKGWSWEHIATKLGFKGRSSVHSFYTRFVRKLDFFL